MYQAKYYQTWVMVSILTLFPCLGVGIMLSVLLAFKMSDWMFWGVAFFGIGGSMAMTLWVVFYTTIAKCSIEILDNSIEIVMDKKYFWYPQKIIMPWTSIKNISGNTDRNANKPFIHMRCQTKPYNFVLSPAQDDYSNLETWNFWLDLEEKINEINKQTFRENQITQHGFFGNWWFIFLAILFVGFFVAGLITKVFFGNDNASWFEIILFGLMGFIFTISIVLSKRKTREIGPDQSSDL